MLQTIVRYVTSVSFALIPPSVSTTVDEVQVKPNDFTPAVVETQERDQWEWYCNDPRKEAVVVEVVYQDGRSSYHDPDLCH